MRRMRIPLFFAVMAASFATSAYAQTFSVAYNLGTNAGEPGSPTISGILTQGRDGNSYGTAPAGAINGLGGVFKLTSAGKMIVLHSFAGSDGAYPNSGLTLGTDGNFYGTATQGGTLGYGTVFKITPTGVLTVLYNFTNGADGSQSYAPPVEGNDGNFYGTTCQCNGAFGAGTIYKITTTGTFTPLFQFDTIRGFYPYAPLVLGTDGNFYGKL